VYFFFFLQKIVRNKLAKDEERLTFAWWESRTSVDDWFRTITVIVVLQSFLGGRYSIKHNFRFWFAVDSGPALTPVPHETCWALALIVWIIVDRGGLSHTGGNI